MKNLNLISILGLLTSKAFAATKDKCWAEDLGKLIV